MREWLKEIRKAKGYSQSYVAIKAGIAQSYYCDLENGDKGCKLPVRTARAIAKVLDFDWTKFYD